MGFSGSSGPSQETRFVAGSTHDSCGVEATTFSGLGEPSRPDSRSRSAPLLVLLREEDEALIDGAREGAAVLTAVGEAKSHSDCPTSFGRSSG